MKIIITTINECNRVGFYQFAKEYLPGSDYDQVAMREKSYGKAYVVLMDGSRIIGVAFGWPRKLDAPTDPSFCLDGIAVSEEYQKKGYGSKLLIAFERAAQLYGYCVVSVGSAGGYVEQYYIGNGYVPRMYKVYTEQGIVVEKEFKNLDEFYAYERQNADGFVVMEKTI